MKKNILLLLYCFLLTLNVFGQFQNCNSPTTNDLYDVNFINENIGVAVGASGTIVRTTDGGDTWSLIMENNEIELKKVKFFNTQNGIAIGSSIYITADAGITWNSVAHTNTVFYDIAILNASTCLLSGFPVSLVKSIDFGQSFTTIIQEQNNSIGLLSFVDENIGYTCNLGAGGSSPTLKTIDGGITWTLLPFDSSVNSVIEAMSFESESTGFKAGWYNSVLKKTLNTGMSWSDVNYETPETYPQLYDLHVNSDFPNAYYACGWYGEIYKSTDGGATWFILSSGVESNTSLYGIYFIDDTKGWAVGYNGLILKTASGGILDNEENVEVGKINIYPNPAKDILHLDTKNEIGVKQLNIYNTLGQIVLEVTNLENNTNIDVANLKSGTYFIKVITDRGTANTKFIKE